jgi:DNA-binding cell septation regulator SpoVG
MGRREKLKSLEIRPLSNNDLSHPLKTFADVELDNGIVVKDLRVIQESCRRLWIAPPQIPWKDPESGQIRYRAIITFPDAMKGEIDLLVLNAWAREKEKDREGSDL